VILAAFTSWQWILLFLVVFMKDRGLGKASVIGIRGILGTGDG
jgi:hypothetical protein